MDLAQYIVDVSVQSFKDDCFANQVEAVFQFHAKYKASLYVVPMANHVIIRYKALEYKINRSDKATYEELINFMLDAVEMDISNKVASDIEYNGYWPSNDEFFNSCHLAVKKKAETVFSLAPKIGNFKSVAFDYLKHLRLVV